MKKILLNPITPAVLGVFNLVLAQGNIWMYITGAMLLLTAAMDVFGNDG